MSGLLLIGVVLKARVGRMKFKMNSSVFPGDEMVLNGSVEKKDHR